jgi:hypothetical protein
MKTEQLTFLSAAPHYTFQQSMGMVFRQTIQMLIAFGQFLWVIDAPVRSAHGGLIRGLSIVYLLPTLIIFGPQAILVMLAYQAGFKLLLRAAV